MADYSSDVTVIAIGVDDELVREGVGMALAARIDALRNDMTKIAVELAGGGLIHREAWDDMTTRAAELADLTKTVEYVRAFYDQWPSDEEEGGDATA